MEPEHQQCNAEGLQHGEWRSVLLGAGVMMVARWPVDAGVHAPATGPCLWGCHQDEVAAVHARGGGDPAVELVARVDVAARVAEDDGPAVLAGSR